MSNIIQTFPKGSGGGHIVLDTSGIAVDQEKKLQFTGLDVSDDSTNEKTEVKAVGLNADSLNDIIQSASVQGNAVASNGLVYSTTEQIVGKWVDGKPLYQKTITTTAPTVATAGTYVTTTVAHGASNVDVIFTPCAFVKDNSNIARMMPYTVNAGYQIKANPGRSGIQFTSAIKDFNGCTCYITIQYTKTTDT